MPRFFAFFPGGLPGFGLLLLRLALGLATVLQSFEHIVAPGPLTLVFGLVCGLSLASGVLLLAGFMTPAAGVLVVTGLALSSLPSATRPLFDSRLAAIFAAIIGTAISLLGPGAFSLDARLFGRREIMIPPSSRRDL
ncbi:MAG: hypothetical protein ABI693_20655 [Bryobacteraceae bacterium]